MKKYNNITNKYLITIFLCSFCVLSFSYTNSNKTDSFKVTQKSSLEFLISIYFDKVATTKSTIYELGSPMIESIEGKDKILQSGNRALLLLIPRLKADSSKEVAYTLDLIKDFELSKETRGIIQSLKHALEKKETKTCWDFTAIGQCNQILR